jgi:hypothetical protein
MDSVVSEMTRHGFSREEALDLAPKIGIKCIADFKRLSYTTLTRYPSFKNQLIRLRNAHIGGKTTLWYASA